MALRTAPRLHHFDYIGPFAYFVTMVTANRRKVFTDPTWLDNAERNLHIAAGRDGYTLYAYCFMPDHLHILISGDEWSSLKRFAQHFKQLTGYAYKQATGNHLWQPSFHDHVLRSPESLEDLARYIWANPVRGGLTDDWTAWRGSGPRPLPELI